MEKYPIEDEQTIKSVKFDHGLDIRFWDEGFGPLWVYRNSLGVLGVVRADTFEKAWSCVVDEILQDVDPDDEDSYARSYDSNAKEGELAEGCHWRGSGVPSNEGLNSHLAYEDLNGSSLDPLTVEDAVKMGIVIELADDGE